MNRLSSLLFATLFALACHAPAAPAGDLSVAPDLLSPVDAAGCTSCSQPDPKACGARPSWCSCYPGPACCCKGIGPG
jgi:hypothetical protein